MIGPDAVASAEVPPQIPTARSSSSGGNAARRQASVAGSIIAPNAPCTTRNRISTSIELDSAQPSEPSANPAIPIMNSRLRPNRSPSRPPNTSSTAIESR